MKIVCYKEELLKGINTVMKAIPTRTTMPILNCILVQAYNGVIKLTANDMELGIETMIAGDIIEQGKIALDSRIFSEMIKKLPDNDITIESEDVRYNTMISCENACYTIKGKDGDEFTGLPSVDKSSYISITQFNLKEIIRQTIFSISMSLNNKMMSGELLEVHGNQLRMVSLDGFRISIRNIELKDNYGDVKVVIPGKTLNEISKILNGDAEAEVLIYFSKNHVLFEFDDTVVVSRLIEGEYFKISHILNGDYETKVTVHKKDLYGCIDRSTLMIKENDKKPIIFSITDDKIELKLTAAIGSLEDKVDVEKTGRDQMIGFNPRYIMDALRVIDDEDITLYILNSKVPCFIKDEKESYIYLIVPINFSTPV